VVAEADTPGVAGAPARWLRYATVLALGGAVLLYVARVDAVCGLYVDDAWYVLLAKALAAGRGYALPNAPSPGILPFYPPGFPWVLSWVFRIAPAFPANLWLLKSVSIAAMLATALLTLRYAAEIAGAGRALALAIALATLLHPAFAFLATATVMSECVFTLVQLATVLVVERVARGRAGAGAALAAGGLGAFAFLVRSMAVGLVATAGLCLAKERRWRELVGFGVGVVLLAGPWVLHARAHAPTPAQQAEMNDYVVFPYSLHFWNRVAGKPQFGTIEPSELPSRVLGVAKVVATRDLGALAVYPVYRLLEPGDWTKSGLPGTVLSVLVGVVMAIGFGRAVRRRIGVAELLVPVTLGVTVLWPFLPFRFVLPLLPFALCYLADGLGSLVGRRATLGVVAAIAAVSVVANVAYAQRLHGPVEQRSLWQRAFDEHRDVIRWVHEHVPPDQPVAAVDPALVALYDDGRKTVGYWQPDGTWTEWRRLGIHYLVDTTYLDEKDESLPEGRFVTVHRSATMNLRVLDLQRIYDAR